MWCKTCWRIHFAEALENGILFFPLFLPSAHLLIFIRKNTDDDKENEDSQRMESYIAHGRTFGRNGDIFNSVNDVVQHGVKLDITDSDDEQEGEVTEQ